MKIGIFVSGSDPSSGGGFTFESEVIKALASQISLSQHEFVLLGFQSVSSPGSPQIENVQYRCVSSESFQAISFIRRFFKGIVQKIHIFKRVNAPKTASKVLKKTFHKVNLEALEDIDFIWYTGPHECLTFDIPYATTIWDLQHRRQPWFPEVSAKGEWERREHHFSNLIRRATVILAGVEAGKQEIKYFYQVSDDRIKTFPHPTPSFAFEKNIECAQEDFFKRYKLPKNYLLYPAQFWPHKNHVNLLLALKRIREDYKIDLSLVFVGSEQGNEAYVKQVTEYLNLREYVHFFGFVSQEDLVQFYSYAFALAYVTFFGPENLPPLEAFALGCPVIASRVAGADEQLGDAALLVNPDSPEDMVNAIDKLWRDPVLRQSLIDRGHTRASQWTTKDYVKAILSIFDELESMRQSWDCSAFRESSSNLKN